jgi:Threonine synthase N terminus
VLALVQPKAEESHEEAVNDVASALLSVAEALGIAGRVVTTTISTAGAAVIERIPTASYISTRDVNRSQLSFCAVAMEGLAKDGGLFVPAQVLSLCVIGLIMTLP